MSLLQSLSHSKRNEILAYSKEKCQIIIKIANLGAYITNVNPQEPGRQLLEALQKSGCSILKFNQICKKYQSLQIKSYYKPQCKIAVLIANQNYQFYNDLFTPIPDCENFKSTFLDLGFITVRITNTSSEELKIILKTIYREIPGDSYVLTYCAGHGCQIRNTETKYINCILGIECPTQLITLNNCVTENFILQELYKSKPELGLLMMDMCRLDLDRESNPSVYEKISSIPEYSIHKNLIITYSTQPSESAFENIECNPSLCINSNESYVKQAGDTGRIRPTSSVYGQAFKNRLTDYNYDIKSLIDLVHVDVEKSPHKQKPVMIVTPSVMPKHSFYDHVAGDIKQIADNLRNKIADLEYQSLCSINIP